MILVSIFCSETDAGQIDVSTKIRQYLSVLLSFCSHQMIHLTNLFHFLGHASFTDSHGYIREFLTVNHFFSTTNFKNCYLHNITIYKNSRKGTQKIAEIQINKGKSINFNIHKGYTNIHYTGFNIHATYTPIHKRVICSQRGNKMFPTWE